MARNYKRDTRGRFAAKGNAGTKIGQKIGQIKARRTLKAKAKTELRGSIAKSNAQFNKDMKRISQMSDAEYNRYVDKGSYAGSRIAGQDLSSAVYDSHQARRANAKAKYQRTLQGAKVKN